MTWLKRCPLRHAVLGSIALLSLVAPPARAQQTATQAERRSAQAARTAQATLGERLVVEAQQMLVEFPKSSYSHTTKIDRELGVCEVDCSGFVATVLAAVSPEHLKVIPLAKAGRKRPLAEDFYAAFAAGKSRVAGWQPIVQVSSARRGDVLAWWKEEHKKGENTGHVMFIAETPVLEQPGKWRLRIIDSTSSPHAQDTRPEGANGLGSGVIWLDVDTSGRILGYRWKSASGKLNEHPVAIGRAV